MKIWVTALAVTLSVSVAHGATRLKRLEALWEKGEAITVQNLQDRGPSLWTGKCVRNNRPEKRVDAQLAVFPEWDEVLLGSLFINIQLDTPPLDPSTLEETYQNLGGEKLDNIQSCVDDPKNKQMAWWEFHNSELNAHQVRNYFSMKTGITKSGVSYLMVGANPSQNYDHRYFCYFMEEHLGGRKGPKGKVEVSTETDREELD